MSSRGWAVSLAAVALLGLTACGADGGQGKTAQEAPQGSPSATTPGMSMAAQSPGSSTPSATATMVCGPEIRRDIAQTLQQPALAAGSATWRDLLYTCTYTTDSGPLVLTVKDSATLSSGQSYFDTLRGNLQGPKPIKGLAAFGLPAFETSDGTVAFLKDGKTLKVDATKLPAVAGPAGQTRTDVAYAIAADVIGCWSE